MAKLYFRYGAMNCGKSTHILQVAHNYEERGMKILLIKPAIDTKGDMSVVSRLGAMRKVDVLVPPQFSLLNLSLDDISCVLVDEAQFLTPAQIDDLFEITKIYDVPVICYGLRTDFSMQGFPGAARLLEIADDIEEMKTICRCGKKATENMRLINGVATFLGEQVVIDNGQDNVTYESVCGKCYILHKKGLMNKNQ